MLATTRLVALTVEATWLLRVEWGPRSNMDEMKVRALFALADIKLLKLWKLPNGYLGELAPLSDDSILRDSSKGETSYFVEYSQEGPSINVVRAWMRDYTWRLNRPSWLVKIPEGLIQLIDRKRVIAIDWSETRVRGIVTKDDVTIGPNHVHAWTEEKMLEYLKAWKILADAPPVQIA